MGLEVWGQGQSYWGRGGDRGIGAGAGAGRTEGYGWDDSR